MPCQQLRLPLLKRLADFQMSAVAKALVTSSNWKVGRWEVRTFQEMGVSNPMGVLYHKTFILFGFSVHQAFRGSSIETLSGNNVHCGEPFGYWCWHFDPQRIFCTKVFSERSTVPQIPKETCLCHLPRRSGL